MVIIPEINPDYFSVQVPSPHSVATGYWRVLCSTCGQSWYVPRDLARRTKEGPSILRQHAREHDQKERQQYPRLHRLH